jgi:hypothetical protein
MRFQALMFLHRDFFKHALADNPTDPLISHYSRSFTTAYECACVILDSTIKRYNENKCLVTRVWRIWTNVYCAAVGNVTHIYPSRFDLDLHLSPGYNWNSCCTYSKHKPRRIFPREAEWGMSFIWRRCKHQRLCFGAERTCMYPCAYNYRESVNGLYIYGSRPFWSCARRLWTQQPNPGMFKERM